MRPLRQHRRLQRPEARGVEEAELGDRLRRAVGCEDKPQTAGGRPPPSLIRTKILDNLASSTRLKLTTFNANGISGRLENGASARGRRLIPWLGLRLAASLFGVVLDHVGRRSRVQPLHVLKDSEEVVQHARCVADGEVRKNLLVIGVDFRESEDLPHVAA